MFTVAALYSSAFQAAICSSAQVEHLLLTRQQGQKLAAPGLVAGAAGMPPPARRLSCLLFFGEKIGDLQ